MSGDPKRPQRNTLSFETTDTAEIQALHETKLKSVTLQKIEVIWGKLFGEKTKFANSKLYTSKNIPEAPAGDVFELFKILNEIQQEYNQLHEYLLAIIPNTQGLLDKEELTPFKELKEEGTQFLLRNGIETNPEHTLQQIKLQKEEINERVEKQSNKRLQAGIARKLRELYVSDPLIPQRDTTELRPLLEALIDKRIENSGLHRLNDILRRVSGDFDYHEIGSVEVNPDEFSDDEETTLSTSSKKFFGPILDALHLRREQSGTFPADRQETEPKQQPLSLAVDNNTHIFTLTEQTDAEPKETTISFPPNFHGEITVNDEEVILFTLTHPETNEMYTFTVYVTPIEQKKPGKSGEKEQIWFEEIYTKGKVMSQKTKRYRENTNIPKQLKAYIESLIPVPEASPAVEKAKPEARIQVKNNILSLIDQNDVAIRFAVPNTLEVAVIRQDDNGFILQSKKKRTNITTFFEYAKRDEKYEFMLSRYAGTELVQEVTHEATTNPIQEIRRRLELMFAQTPRPEPLPPVEDEPDEDEPDEEPEMFEPETPETEPREIQRVASLAMDKETLRKDITGQTPFIESEVKNDIEVGGGDVILRDSEQQLYAVFDGVSTVEKSAELAEFCAQWIQENLQSYIPNDLMDTQIIQEQLKFLTVDLLEVIDLKKEFGGSSTATITVVRGDKAYVAYIGDSPVNVYRPHNRLKNRLERLTQDDNPIFFLLQKFPTLCKKIQRDFDNYQGDPNTFSDFRLPLMDTTRLENMYNTANPPHADHQRAVMLEMLDMVNLARNSGQGYFDVESSKKFLGLAFTLNNILGSALGFKNQEFRFATTTLGPDDVLVGSSDGFEGLTTSENIEAIEESNDAQDIATSRFHKVKEILRSGRFRKKFDDLGEFVVQKQTAEESAKLYIDEVILMSAHLQPTQTVHGNTLLAEAQRLYAENRYYEALRYASVALREFSALDGVELPNPETFPPKENADIFITLAPKMNELSPIERAVATQVCQAYTYTSNEIFVRNMPKICDYIPRLTQRFTTFLREAVLAIEADGNGSLISAEQREQIFHEAKSPPQPNVWAEVPTPTKPEPLYTFAPAPVIYETQEPTEPTPRPTPSPTREWSWIRSTTARIGGAVLSAAFAFATPFVPALRKPKEEISGPATILSLKENKENQQIPLHMPAPPAAESSEAKLPRDASVLPDAAPKIPNLPVAAKAPSAPASEALTPRETKSDTLVTQTAPIHHRGTTIGIVVDSILEQNSKLNLDKIKVRREVAQFALKDAAHSQIAEGNTLEFQYSITPQGGVTLSSIHEIKTEANTNPVAEQAPQKPERPVQNQVEQAKSNTIQIASHSYEIGKPLEYIPLASQPGQYTLVGLSEDGKAIILQNATNPKAPQFAVNLKNAESRVLSPDTAKFSIDGLRFEKLFAEAFHIHFTTESGKGVIRALELAILHLEYNDEDTPENRKAANEKANAAVRAAEKDGHIVDTYDVTKEYTEISNIVVPTDSFVVARKNNTWVIESAHFARGKAKEI